MNDRQSQTEFLRQCLLYDASSERHQLVEVVGQVQRKERCVRRAVWLMVLVAALACAGLAYSAVFLEDFPRDMQGFKTRLITKLFSVLVLASLICIPAFLVLELIYRRELNQCRETCRRLATELLQSRLGHPHEPKATVPDSLAQNGEGAGCGFGACRGP